MSNSNLTDLGAFLKEARIQSNLTQAELSEKIRVSKQTVYSWETGRSCPSDGSLKRLSDVLNLSLFKARKLKGDLRGKRLSKRQGDLKSAILSSKDPVVSQWTPNFIPLLDKKTSTFPLDSVHNPLKWEGKRCFLPENLYPGHLFGFEIDDRSMEPAYGAGDVILADLRQKIRDGRHVVVKIEGFAPFCRLYLEEEGQIILKALSLKVPPVRVPKSSIEWMYGTATAPSF